MLRRHFLQLLSSSGMAVGTSRFAALTQDGIQRSDDRRKDTSNARRDGFYEFSPDGTECIIQRPDTPVPWMNLLANDTFQTWITHQGNIESALLDRSVNGLTNPQDTSGFVYIRDRHTGQYHSVNRPAANIPWQCRHGLGYTAITTSDLGLTTTVTYFVPRQANLVVWLLSVHNELPSAREIDIFSTVEWNLGDQNKRLVFAGHGGGGDAFTGASQFNLFKKVSYKDGVLYANQQVWRSLKATAGEWPYTGFMASSVRPTSYECLQQHFIGLGRTQRNPLAVEEGECTNHGIWSENLYPWGVLHHRLKLAASGTESLVILTGMSRNRADIASTVASYATAAAATRELLNVKRFWKDFIGNSLTIHTPEHEIDRNLNIWSKYQWRNNMMRNETTHLRGLGFWSYGLVSRSSGSGITEVIVQPHDLEIAREATVQFLQLQYHDIGLHKLSDDAPLLKASELGLPWPPPRAIGPFQYPHSHETDNIYPIAQYVIESGDLRFLDQTLPYIDGSEATVFDHLARAIEYSVQGLSERGLPRLCVGIGDWNDELNGLSREGKAESVMMGMELCHHLRDCATVATAYGRTKEAGDWMSIYTRIKEALNRYAWDGEWYVRAFADGGPQLQPIGTSRDKEGRIYLNTQSWAVLSGVAEGNRARQCMESVRKYLMSEYGPLLLAPAYTHFERQVGIQSAYAPGWRNANVYFRPAGWAIMAACIANLPDLAFDMYKKACISEQSKNILRYLNEPYAYSENVNGPAHPLAGAAQYQWNLGEGANWMWHSYVYYILGIRPVMDGLLVDPKIPFHWPGFSMTRPFQDAIYHIQVSNPNRASQRTASLTIDGRHIVGNVIPSLKDGRTHSVEAILRN